MVEVQNVSAVLSTGRDNTSTNEEMFLYSVV